MTSPVILCMEVDHDDEVDSHYRLLVGETVRYIDIAPATFDRDTLSLPLHALPELPYGDENWNFARISRNPATGELQTHLATKELPGVRSVWHPVHVDVLDLENNRTAWLSGAAFQANLPWTAIGRTPTLTAIFGHPASQGIPESRLTVIAKIARFDWEISYIERETQAYRRLQELGASDLAPRFLAHLHESGRVIGLLLEHVEAARKIAVQDLDAVQQCLAKFHNLGLLHGDVNRYNFILGKEGEMKPIDFERWQDGASPEAQAQEMESLRGELLDESGRGGGFVSESSESGCDDPPMGDV